MTATNGAAGRPSLVDGAEHAVRDWLAPGRFREGDRLPPEQELASMLGVSRGTLRTALRRLEDSGEIVRRQGSGTYVGRVPALGQGERLRRVEGYSLVLPRGPLSVASLSVSRGRSDERPRRELALSPGQELVLIERLIATGEGPAAVCRDYFAPAVQLPGDDELARMLAAGATSFDVLVSTRVAVSTSRSTISSRLVSGDDPDGSALGLPPVAVACTILEELVLDTDGRPVLFTRDVLVPEQIGLEILQSVSALPPPPVDH